MTKTTMGRAAGVLLLAGLAGAASAKDAEVSPVARWFETMDVGPGIEHRVVVVHPILATPTVVKPADAVTLGGLAPPELLGLTRPEKAAKPHAEALSFQPTRTALLAGDVLHTDVADYAVARDSVLLEGKPAAVPLLRISREVPPDPASVEPAMLGSILPSALRWLVLNEVSGAEIREACEKWAAELGLDAGRRSPVEFAAAEAVAKRVADYRKALAGVARKPAADGREVVGVAFLLEGQFASIEAFADGKTFAAAWPKLLDAIAVEAAVQEVRDHLIASDMPESADPDRFVSDLKKRLLGVYAAKSEDRDVRDEGRQTVLSIDACAANALLLRSDRETRVVHFVLVVDPARRGEGPHDKPDPTPDSRKPRPTEEEQRVIDRRNGGSAAPKPPEPPPAPPPPK